MKVLVTGPTGATGTEAVRSLLKKGMAVRAFVHKLDERSQLLASLGAEIVQGDLLDFDAVSASLKGISRAYFVFDIQVPGLVQATAYFAQAAKEEKLEHVVNMSQISARRAAKSHAAQNHWLAERMLVDTGIPVTHLRPTFFAEWLTYLRSEIRDNNRIIMPFADVRYAPIAGEDLGRVIAAILVDPQRHAGKTYPLFGAKELNQYEVAEIMSAGLGRNITYIPVSIPQFAEILSQRFSPYFVQHISNVAQDCLDGIFSGINDSVEQISGSKPLTMSEYIRKNKAAFEKDDAGAARLLLRPTAGK